MITLKYNDVLYDVLTDQLVRNNSGKDVLSLKLVNITGDTDGKLTIIGYIDGQSEELMVKDRNEKHAWFGAKTNTQFILNIKRVELEKAINKVVSFKDLKYLVTFKGFEASEYVAVKIEDGCEYNTPNDILDAYENYTLKTLEQPTSDIMESFLNEFFVELKRH